MSIAAPEIVMAKWLDHAEYTGEGSFSPTTAASVVYVRESELPLEFFSTFACGEPVHAASLDWISLSRAVLPNARSMTSSERRSVNEFFWSHFK
jgi:hypothetical protein